MISLARRDGRVLRIGHRGAAALAPENTLASFRAAAAAGVDLIEFDVLALRRGDVVVAHSHDLHEVSHGAARGTLRTMELDEIRAVCPALPTLEEALEFFADADGPGPHVDVKSARAGIDVVAALRRHGLVERTLVSSFHRGMLRRLTGFEPRLRLGVSFPRDLLGLEGRRGSSAAVGGGLRALRRATPGLVGFLLARSGASALVLHHALVTASSVRSAHSRGAPVVAWTVDDRRELERVDEAGVDAVVTNDPSIFVSTLEVS